MRRHGGGPLEKARRFWSPSAAGHARGKAVPLFKIKGASLGRSLKGSSRELEAGRARGKAFRAAGKGAESARTAEAVREPSKRLDGFGRQLELGAPGKRLDGFCRRLELGAPGVGLFPQKRSAPFLRARRFGRRLELGAPGLRLFRNSNFKLASRSGRGALEKARRAWSSIGAGRARGRLF